MRRPRRLAGILPDSNPPPIHYPIPMQFTPDHFRRFALGVTEHTFRRDTWIGRRIAEPMAAIYRGNLESRMNCSAGVRLRFASDTTRIAARWTTVGPYRKPHVAGICVDGNDLHTATGNNGEPFDGPLFEQPQRNLRVFDIYLPYGAQCAIQQFTLDDGCRLEPAPPLKKKWLILGDSITQGAHASQYAMTVAGRCTRALQLDALNLAVGSATLDPRLAKCIPPYDFDVATIAYGINDYYKNVPLKTFTNAARALIDTLHESRPMARILLIAPTVYLGHEDKRNDNGDSLNDYRAALQTVADIHDSTVCVDGLSLLPQQKNLIADDVHPNDKGFAHYADNLLPHLKAKP